MDYKDILPVSKFLDKKIVQDLLIEFMKPKLDSSIILLIKTISIKELYSNVLVLSIENEIIEKKLKDNKLQILMKEFFQINFYHNSDFQIEFIYEIAEKEKDLNDYTQKDLQSLPKQPKVITINKNLNEELIKNIQLDRLNPDYTFETFVMGKSNDVAFEMAKSLSDTNVARINPLFIYGGVGLGKTHLLHAMAHRIRVRQPDAKIIFSSCEMLMNSYIEGVKRKDYNSFRIVREADALFIDDIQFLENKDHFQEEFYNMFNALNDRYKHVAVASDRSPDQLRGLDDRILSRFKGGACVDIKLPDLETRMIIIQNLAQAQKIDFSSSMIEYFASSISSNVRELKGCFNRIIILSSIRSSAIDKDLIDEGLSDYINTGKPPLSPENIQKVVAKKYNIEYSDLFSLSKKNAISYPRQVAMYLIRELTDNTLKGIADSFGKKDHVTVSHACSKITEIIKNDRMKARVILDLQKQIERDFER